MPGKKSSSRKRIQVGRTKVSHLREKDKVVCFFASDIHLCLKPPVARSAEPSWFNAMDRPLQQLRFLMAQHGAPVVYPGDIFDRWNSTPKLINFAIENLPPGYAIPGQHDLPYHNVDNICDSAFWTLCEAGTITYLEVPETIIRHSVGLTLYPFEWKKPLTRWEGPLGQHLRVAVCHAYCWVKGHSFPGAPATGQAQKLSRQLTGYDLAVFGDNHKGFFVGSSDVGTCPPIINCGGFIRRKIDESNYKPKIWALLADGGVAYQELNLEKDRFIKPSKLTKGKMAKANYAAFLDELAECFDQALSFRDTVNRFASNNTLREPVRRLLLELIEEG